jgi:hypothetical protein
MSLWRYWAGLIARYRGGGIATGRTKGMRRRSVRLASRTSLAQACRRTMPKRYTHPTEARKQAALETFSLSTQCPHEPIEDEEKAGGPHGIRTHDLRVANAALSQLS